MKIIKEMFQDLFEDFHWKLIIVIFAWMIQGCGDDPASENTLDAEVVGFELREYTDEELSAYKAKCIDSNLNDEETNRESLEFEWTFLKAAAFNELRVCLSDFRMLSMVDLCYGLYVREIAFQSGLCTFRGDP